MMRRQLLGALAAAGLAACAGRRVTASRTRGPLLWLAQRGRARVYILGVAEATNHSWQSAPIERAFAESGNLWLETAPPPAPGTEAKARYEALTAQLGYRAGRGFYDTLEPSVRDRARAYVVELAIDPSEIESMQPWLAYYTINGAFWKKYPPLHEVEYIDQTLSARARQAGKALHYEFPTREDSTRWFAAMSDQVQSQWIALLLDFFDDQKRGLNDACEGWMIGQPCTRIIDRMRSKTPALYAVLQRDRNVWWARTIRDQLTAGGNHLVVLGMNHVLGPDGVPQQLARIDIAAPEVGDSPPG
jgi:uncharacterized protein YbaP (TraB family)